MSITNTEDMCKALDEVKPAFEAMMSYVCMSVQAERLGNSNMSDSLMKDAHRELDNAAKTLRNILTNLKS